MSAPRGSRERDLATVESMRRAHARRIDLARAGRIPEALDASDEFGATTYVVKILDVTPGLGKVAGRRLLAALGVDGFATVADLGDDTRAAIVDACRIPPAAVHGEEEQ